MSLYRKLQSITGHTPTDFIRSIRLKRAAQLLQGSQLPIVEIANRVGFSSPSYFSKCFREMFGMLPKQYAEESGRKEWHCVCVCSLIITFALNKWDNCKILFTLEQKKFYFIIYVDMKVLVLISLVGGLMLSSCGGSSSKNNANVKEVNPADTILFGRLTWKICKW